MSVDLRTLTHLAGYATIASVLATATWAGPLARVAVVPIVLGTLLAGMSFLRGRRSGADPDLATDGVER
jgi:hypothetical protein